jgi:hypothetical protein
VDQRHQAWGKLLEAGYTFIAAARNAVSVLGLHGQPPMMTAAVQSVPSMHLRHRAAALYRERIAVQRYHARRTRFRIEITHASLVSNMTRRLEILKLLAFTASCDPVPRAADIDQ